MAEHKVVCWDCGADVTDPFVNTCPRCGGLLTVKMELEKVKEMKPQDLRKTPLGVWRYAPSMPVDAANKVSIQEGGTPLYPVRALGAEVGVPNSFVKFEGLNPTGSFKDRGMTMGVSHARELGAKVVGCASTGNTSASLAAYAAKAGMKCAVFLPSGKVAMGKLAQALFFGAKVLSVDGNFDDALALARKMADERKLYLLNSINPYRPEGQKSVLFEIMDQLEYNVPDRIILPVGNAANIRAVYKAVSELKEVGWIDKVPMLTAPPPSPGPSRPTRRTSSPRSTRRQWPPPSGSGTPSAGGRRSTPCTPPEATAPPSPTRRSSPRSSSWAGGRVSASSPHPRHPSQVSGSSARRVSSTGTSAWSASAPATA